MNAKDNLAQLYDTLLCIPGMNDTVKLDIKISRKDVLLLTQVIDRGLTEELQNPTGLLATKDKGAADTLHDIVRVCLERAGLTELMARLKQH